MRGKGDLLVIMLGSESTNPSPARPASVPSNTANSDAGGSVSSRLRATLAAAARNPLAERLQERLIQDLGPLPGRTIHVESVGRRNSTVAEQASLINKQVLPRKPALVIWNLGRTDTRRGLPPANMARALDRGLEQLRRQHIDTIVMDPPYHPQFEAFYRTDDYRQYIRWTMNLHDQPYLQRYDMIDYWASTGRIDLDSGEPDRQAAAVTFTETCIAYQLSRMIDRGLSRKRDPGRPGQTITPAPPRPPRGSARCPRLQPRRRASRTTRCPPADSAGTRATCGWAPPESGR